ncbi:MAG: hypothetical protein GY805_29985 [Chloroflexi bacterium]|nr:hypothetical protein [Chloroflexota bacterium]
MKSSQTAKTNHFDNRSADKTLPNSEMMSRQIESLRLVLRRMKTAPSASLDLLISQKLKELQIS